ncbi:MAG: asparagine synthase-related protein, partial [Acidimicrobiia bacterium]|nr:asparagine synthase-related protein [Acidimicrobiia bacterium]
RIDALALSLIRQTEGARSNDKVRFVAPAFGLEPLLPFCDWDLADYYFNLPEGSRYNAKTGVNKVLLRELLDQRIRYSESGVGDGYFEFDGAGFVMANQAFVREEILECGLWDPEAEAIVDAWLEALPQRPFLFHVLVPMFLLSGWYNHSRYLTT